MQANSTTVEPDANAGSEGTPTATVGVPLFCPNCGTEITGRTNKRYCSPECRSEGRVKSRPFIGIDGEGVGSDYILLASQTPDRGLLEISRKPGRLGTRECLDFLLNLQRGSNAGLKPIYVWFAFDYDVNMILQDVPFTGRNSIAQLRETNRINWKGYRITYIRRKILRISRGNRRHTSYDIWGFFQSTFERALTDWGIPIPKIISKGKSERSDFSKWNLDDVIRYNNAELTQLANLAEKLRDSIIPLELPIQSWHGPAALAASWLRKNHVKEWLHASVAESPADLQDVAKRAYFGGRIDVLGYGIVEPVFHYDIVSAYPSSARFLPNLRNLRWKRQKERPQLGGLYVSRIKWEIPESYWGPFPWRARNGSIRYPLEGEGWYWYPEVETALRMYGEKHFEIVESWVASGEIQYPFRNLITETFEYRNQLKLQNHPSHVAVKLVLNSLYGKFAQTVGRATYYSPIWAGLITSHTRAQLMSVINNDVVCVMTDSIWSKKPLQVPIGKGLGDWEYQPDRILYLAEAGLYQAETASGVKHVWQRGFDKRNPVDIETLVKTWLYDDPSYRPTYKVNRFIGMGLASMTSYPWCHWLDLERNIEPVPLAGTTKRLPFYPVDTEPETGNFVPLRLRPRDTDELSYPYAKLTTDENMVMQRLEDECEDD